MKYSRKIPTWARAIIIVIAGLILLQYTAIVFRSFTLVFFLLWIACPFLAWSLRSALLEKPLAPLGFSKVRGILMGIAVVISFSFFADYNHLRANFYGKAILWLSGWVMIGMVVCIPYFTWIIASKSIEISEGRKRTSDNRIDDSEE